MKTAGDVAHADVLTREDGKSKGCGLVTYRSEEDAANAIAELNETELCDRLASTPALTLALSLTLTLTLALALALTLTLAVALTLTG